ncbi:MAG TPA: hypothetical protein VJJ21_03615 [Candidatus Nanoarchaeia archaeon]|nr:hypothetical protein [Candidatus Nanoarchaeia archaeon]
MKITIKNYIVIILGLTIGFLLLVGMEYTGSATKAPQLKLIVQEDYKETTPGSTIKSTLVVYEVERIERLYLVYTLRKVGSTEETSKEVNLDIEKDTTSQEEFTIPKESEPGIYQLRVKIKDTEVSSSDIFEVKKSKGETKKTILSILTYLLIFTFLSTIAILVKKNLEWIKNFRVNLNQILFDIKWSARRNNFFLKYFYLAIAILIIIIIILWKVIR